MNCFPCFTQSTNKTDGDEPSSPTRTNPPPPQEIKKENPDEDVNVDTKNIEAKNFNFRELATATKNFRRECLLGEGGFGRVYKGTLSGSGQTVAVKQLDRNGMQGNKEFLVEVLVLSLLHHENLVNLIGYCADGDQRLLVHEFISGGSLEECLLDKKSLDWYTRMKIASGAARGLEYLHDRANPPVIFRDLKSANILLDEELNPKLSDFGLAKLGPGGGDKPSHIAPASRVMGTYGYSAPEYARSGELTLKSDVYSFGVVLLELITGRRAIDTTKPNDEQNLVSWAQPIFRDPKKFPDMADPTLNKRFPAKDLNQAVAIASMCLQEEPPARPLISDVVTALSFLSTAPKDEPANPADPSVAAAAADQVNTIANESGGGNPGEPDKGEESDGTDVEDAGENSGSSDDDDKEQEERKNWHSSSNTSSRNLERNRSSKSNGKGRFESDNAVISSSSRKNSSRESSRKNSRKGNDRVSGSRSGSSSDSSYSSDQSESEASNYSRSTRRSDYGSFKSYDDRSSSRVASHGNTSLNREYSEGSTEENNRGR